MRVFLAHNTLRQILKMPYYRVNHSDDITWREDDVTFVVVMASHIAPGGLSDFVFTNGRQKDLSKKIVTTGWTDIAGAAVDGQARLGLLLMDRHG